MSTAPTPDTDHQPAHQGCTAPLHLGTVDCASSEHARRFAHWQSGITDGTYWSVHWWRTDSAIENPDASANEAGQQPEQSQTAEQRQIAREVMLTALRLVSSEWPRETLSPRAAQSFIKSLMDDVERLA